MAQVFQIPYGAFELKRCYQKNMLAGNISTITLTCLIIFSIWLYSVLSPAVEVDIVHPDRPIDSVTIVINRPPTIDYDRSDLPTRRPRSGGTAGEHGIPVIVDDDLFVDEDVNMLTRDDKYNFNPNAIGDGDEGGEATDGYYGGQGYEEYIPPPNQFVIHEEKPVLVFEQIPDYPKLALEGGFAAVVVVEAYVGRTGKVLKAHTVKCNRPNIGFEEAAIKAAFKNQYRPAIQNGNPIGVWISYRVEFTLDRQSLF